MCAVPPIRLISNARVLLISDTHSADIGSVDVGGVDIGSVNV